MSHAILATTLTLALALASAAQAADAGLTIAEHGHSDYAIVIADDASPSAKHGAAELRTFLKQMTGADLPIVSDRQPVRAHEILVGDSAHLRQLSTKIDYRALGKEGYVLRTVGPHLVISGGALRGTMYGVYGLLEDHLGCHWFTPQVSHLPAQGASLRIESTLISTSADEQPISGRTSFDLTLGPGREMRVIMPDGVARDVPGGEEVEALTIDPAALASGVTLMTRSGGAGVRLIASGADLKRAEIRGDATRPRVTVTLVLEGTLPGGGSTALQQTVELLPTARTR